MSYNLTAVTDNITGFVPLLQAVNTHLMSGYLGILLLIGLSAVFLLGFFFATGDIKKALAGSSFVSFVLCVLLLAMQLLPPQAIFFSLVASAGMLAVSSNK